MKKSRAFSLVELSIVIMIIGILIAGVIQGSRIIAQMKLSAARSLTQGSDVNGISDIILWLDATAEGMLANASSGSTTYISDGDEISPWTDQNPQTTSKFSFTQSTAGAYPTYKQNGINGLPTLRFDPATDGTAGDALFTSYSATLNPSQFTIFIVLQPIEIGSSGDTHLSYSGGGYHRLDYRNSLERVDFWTYYGGFVSGPSITGVSHNKVHILDFIMDATTKYIYRDGANLISSAIGGNTPGSSGGFILGSSSASGGSQSFDGYISEFIMFSRALKTAERQSVEKYLGKKYGVKIS